ncbi:MAG: hypothetical protein AAB683_00795 [Patescibacteria group bacterium]
MTNLPDFEIEIYFKQIIDFLFSNYPTVLSWIKLTIGFIIGLSIPISLIFLIGIIYSVEKLKSIRKKEEAIYSKPKENTEVVSIHEVKGNKEMADRWNKAINHVESPNENDWRQSIIEADIILGDLLVKLGYRGMSIGEQLKRVEKGDFQTLDEAWEAHKIRNEIAHAGSEYKLSQSEARRVISLYRKVFEEFYNI